MPLQNKNGSTIKFKNAEQMLDIIRSEYESEKDRKKILDGKATTFIMINIAVLTIFIPLIPFSEFINFISNAVCYQKILIGFTWIILAISVTLLILAFILLVQAAGIKGYDNVNVDSVCDYASKCDENCDLSEVQKEFVEHYHQILRGTLDKDGNYKINNNRADKIDMGIRLTVVGCILLFISTIVIRIFI